MSEEGLRRRLRLGTAVVLLLTIGVFAAWPEGRGFVSEVAERLRSGDLQGLAEYLRTFGAWAWLVSTGLMVFQALAAPLPAVLITLTNALIYGPWLGALLSWSSAMLAAVICLVIGRSFGRPVVDAAFGKAKVDAFDRYFERYGSATILVSRLIPIISFDLVSYAAGFTAIRFWPFVIATGLGQIPATLVYSFAGARMEDSPSDALRIALWFLGPAALICAVLWYRARRAT